MPPGMARNIPGEESPPEGIPVATGGVRNGPIDSDDDEPSHAGLSNPGPSNAIAAAAAPENANLVSPLASEDEDSEEDGEFNVTRISDVPPMLPGIEIGESGIELPSRFPSKATSKGSTRRAAKMMDAPLIPDMPTRVSSAKPNVPRKSSRRKSQSADMTHPTSGFLHKPKSSLDSSRLPFEHSTSSNRESTISTKSSIPPPDASGHERDTALRGFPVDFRDDRPTSVGYVNQHSIRTINQSEHPEFLGTSAEVVDGRHSGASSMEHKRQ